ncbi:MAG: hypothetical protein ACK6AT_08595, partial [Planctomycetota bacterium]
SLSATRSNQLSYVRESHRLCVPKWTGKFIDSFPDVNGKNPSFSSSTLARHASAFQSIYLQ